ncbi:FecR family protein [Sphingobacterium humi]|uniref:DUF4974 domain-containing protein n=1 Tax=Sphingobacterium humi TaxID=1796905 RepID=A0A6N8L2H5_9SPHI|nr:FecR domain-containing protein [Sphingobacterium humi]MVZ63219.1 DUF4974 domain-containing protein [Sphingobacterium humi]
MKNIPTHIIQILAYRHIEPLNEQQKDQLASWLAEDAVNQDLLTYFDDKGKLYQDLQQLKQQDADGAWEKHRLLFEPAQQTPVRKMQGQAWVKWTLAIAALCLLAFGVFLYQSNKIKEDQQFADSIKPGSDKATLLLADGQTIELSEDASGIRIDSNMKDADGNPVLSQAEKQALSSFTVATPMGGQFNMTLPDGTKVWLNSNTTLTYESLKDQRIVNLQGEAYFEVASLQLPGTWGKANKLPFVVQTKDQRVEVLGTQFNVKSFAEEKTTATTLLEGQVQIAMNTQQMLLYPGEQAVSTGQRLKKQNVNMSTVMAWKQGEFVFNEEKLGEIIAQLERWYNVKFELQDARLADIRFEALVSKHLQLKEILNLLELTGKVRFIVKDQKILVKRNTK